MLCDESEKSLRESQQRLCIKEDELQCMTGRCTDLESKLTEADKLTSNLRGEVCIPYPANLPAAVKAYTGIYTQVYMQVYIHRYICKYVYTGICASIYIQVWVWVIENSLCIYMYGYM